MILDNSGLKGIKADLAHLDKATTKVGFFRWQWEYTRATYEYKIEDKVNKENYYVRFNTRAIEGKLESPSAVLVIEDAYLGRATYPHGLDYDSPLPDAIVKQSQQKLAELKEQLA